MSHKLTAAGLAAEVARTDFALPEADWNEPQAARPPLTPRQKIEALDAELRRDDLDSSVRAAFIVERAQLAQLEAPRTGRATWGPRDTVVYTPRWTSDHHPWAAIGPSGQPNGIRYSNQEVDED